MEMTSIKLYTGVLQMLGWIAECLMNDWNLAYNHTGVVEVDHFLQVIEWGYLVFGCKSSPFFYNEAARLLIMIIQNDVGMDCSLPVQQLDDNSVADERYRYIVAECGISLADESKPDKAFAPAVKEEILGIWYELEKWTWKMDDRRWLLKK